MLFELWLLLPTRLEMALSGTRDSTSTPADEDAGIFARFNKCWYVNVARKDEDVHLLSLQDHLIVTILVILAILAKETLIQRLQSGVLEALHPSTLAPTDLDGVTCCVLCSRVNTGEGRDWHADEVLSHSLLCNISS